MILGLDTSALLQRYIGGPYSAAVNTAMAQAPQWAVSDLTRTELVMALHRVSPDPVTAAALTAAARADLDAMLIVPLDSRCLGRAVELGSLYGLRTVDAVHLAALDRLPRPLQLATLDARQIPAAVALEMELVTPTEGAGEFPLPT